ncbi:MAG: histone deacetylase family protein [Chloroflexota bacterium]|nr:histone deacetylase family protein [Chloroflexota bacterium]
MSASIPVVASPAHLGHTGLVEVQGGRQIPCYEQPERITRIERALAASGGYDLKEPMAHGLEPITAVHDPVLVDLLEHVWADAVASGATDGVAPLIPDTFLVGPYAVGGYSGTGTARPARLGAHCLDTATPIVGGTHAAARAAVDVALTASDEVLGGARIAYALCRPPGHHANRTMYGGYCFFNNAAIVAEALLARGSRRVAILDVDYHHGNGTQQLFWERAEVLYVSLHADPARAFPYFSGHADETGGGSGTGTTLNFPLADGTEIGGYLAALGAACEAIDGFAPDAPLVVSLGFDTFERDPIGDLAIRTADYAEIGGRIAALSVPTVILQEGGYDVEAIGANAVSFMGGLRA